MSVPTFVPPINPQPGAKQKPKVSLLVASFGDGYTQISPDGFNSIRKIWDLTWPVLSQAQAESIDAFFTYCGGWQQFYYTVPGTSQQIRWTCDDWDYTVNQAGTYAVTAKITQSFNLDF